MSTKGQRAKVFWTGTSQAVRLPRELRIQGDTVFVRWEGGTITLDPDGWPEGYVESFAGITDSFERPPQG